MADIHISSTAEDLARNTAEFVAALSNESVHVRGRFVIALSGGSTPRQLYEVLASPPHSTSIAWANWQVFWSDERCVSPYHEDSNYRMAKEALLDHIPTPARNIHRTQGEISPHYAALDCEAQLHQVFRDASPVFDLILLGIGEDGHTASLFPGTKALKEKSRLVMENWIHAYESYRITFTFPLINMTRALAFLVADESKAEVLKQVLESANGDPLLPASMVNPDSGLLHWFVTKDAASLLEEPIYNG